MNIKSIANNILPFEIKKVERKQQKTEGSTDRDAQPNHEHGQDDQRRRHLSEEEIQAALENLKNIPGIKDNNLNVRLLRDNGIVLVLVEDYQGKVIRRIPEFELSSLAQRAKAKGNILDKKL